MRVYRVHDIAPAKSPSPPASTILPVPEKPSIAGDPIAESFLGLGVAHPFNRQFDEARAMMLRSLQESPNSVPTYRWLAVCYTQMRRLDEAREIVNQVRRVMPGALPGASPYRNLEHRELYLLSVRLAMGERRHD